MTRIEKVVQLIKDNGPSELKDFKKLGLKLKRVGIGAFRSVYKIKGVSLVVKFPLNESGKIHSRAEYDVILDINSSWSHNNKILKQYLPEIFYFDPESTVIVMHYYKELSHAKARLVEGVIDNLVKLTWPFAKDEDTDIGYANLGLSPDGSHPIFLDLGYFTPEGKYY